MEVGRISLIDFQINGRIFAIYIALRWGEEDGGGSAVEECPSACSFHGTTQLDQPCFGSKKRGGAIPGGEGGEQTIRSFKIRTKSFARSDV